MLIIQPASYPSGGHTSYASGGLASYASGGGEFAKQILSDLIAGGFSGQEPLDEFKTRLAKVRPAIETMLNNAGDSK